MAVDNGATGFDPAGEGQPAVDIGGPVDDLVIVVVGDRRNDRSEQLRSY